MAVVIGVYHEAFPVVLSAMSPSDTKVIVQSCGAPAPLTVRPAEKLGTTPLNEGDGVGVTAGVPAGVEVGAEVGVTAGVAAGVAVGVGVTVAAGVAVGAGVEETPCVAVTLGVGVGDAVTGVPVLVGVGVGDDPTTGVGVGDAVGVTVTPALGNGVALKDGIGVGVGGIKLGSMPTAKFSRRFSMFWFNLSPYSRRILPKRAMSKLVSSTAPSSTSLGVLFISECLMKYFVIFGVFFSSNYLLRIPRFTYSQKACNRTYHLVYSTVRSYCI